MKAYKIKSPSGRTLTVWAETYHHAINKAMVHEDYKFIAFEYFKTNQKYASFPKKH